jgi:tRNA(adenine34) deaminase
VTSGIPGTDEAYMRRCIDIARVARQRGDAPVGALIVRDGQSIAGHAEIVAIRLACQVLGSLDLTGCILYTNAEPCVMCGYAIRQARIGRVVFGAAVPEMGSVTSRYPILIAADVPGWQDPPIIVDGVLGDECASLFSRQ